MVLLKKLNELFDGHDQADTSPQVLSVSGGADVSFGGRVQAGVEAAGYGSPAAVPTFEAHSAAPLARGGFVSYTSCGVYPLPPATGGTYPVKPQRVKSFLRGCVRNLACTQGEYLPDRTPPPNGG